LRGDRTIEQGEPKRFLEVFEWKLIVDSEAKVNETARRSRIKKFRNFYLGFPYFLRDREQTASRRRQD